MSTQRPTSLYEKYAASGAESYERYFVPAIGEPAARLLIAAARPASGERVLDVACGTGIASRLAVESVGPDGAVVGLDLDPGMLEVARRVSPDSIDWHEASAEEIPFAPESFDLVLCSISLQFFPRKEQAVREMHRVLVPGGRVVWCTPGPTPPFFQAIGHALANHVGPGASMFVDAVFSLYDSTEAHALMQDAGFDRVDVQTTTVPLRVDPPADFLWQYAQSTPLAGAVAVLGESERAALEAEVVERCRPFVENGRSILEPGFLITTAYRQEQ